MNPANARTCKYPMIKLFRFATLLCLCIASFAHAQDELQPQDLLLTFIPNIQFSPFYVGIERGIFAEAGYAMSIEHLQEPEVLDLVAVGRANYGIVTQEQAARYLAEGWQRAQQEWPWTGVLFYWFLKRPGESERDQSWYYFRMLEPDFTPLPVYHSAREYIAGERATLYPGVHQAESREIQAGDAQLRPDPGAQFGQLLEADTLEFRARGTHVWARVRRGGAWERGLLAQSALTQTQEIRLAAVAGERLRVDSITVSDRAWATQYGLVMAALLAAGMLLWVALDALGQRRR